MRILKFFFVFVLGLTCGITLSYFLFQFSFSPFSPTSLTTPAPSASSQSTLPEIYRKTLSEKTPILMYHHIRTPPKGANRTEFGLDVSPLNFEEQMAYSYTKGYKTISLDEDIINLKEKALSQYKSQLKSPFLRDLIQGFVRQNELLSKTD